MTTQDSKRPLLRKFAKDDVSLFELRHRMQLIGSSPESDIVIQDPSVGEVAAKIEPEGDTYRIEAVQKSAVRVNGKKIKTTSLATGDRIEIGGLIMIFDMAQGAAGTAQCVCSSGQTLAALTVFADIVGPEHDLHNLLTKMMELLLKLLNGSDAFIFKLDADGKPQAFVTTGGGASEERFSDSVVQSVIGKKSGLLIPNTLADPVFSQAQSIADLKLASVVCAPIMIAGRLIGIIYVGSSKPSVSFSRDDLSTLSMYASIAGMLINHVDYIGRQNKTIADLTSIASNHGFIAESKAMRDVLSSVSAISASDITVLLQGPTGCGKSFIAEHIHKKSRRAGNTFLVVNCSSLRGELLESELFGHKKGSFTGAVSDHEGLFAAARGGTLFLDEIGDLELPIQAKLLRVLESGSIRPLGAALEIAVDVRIICATNKDLAAMAAGGTFRTDLYYRINQFGIPIPSLSERVEDVVPLAYYFFENYKVRYPTKNFIDFEPEAIRFIQYYDWPGNIRELSNTIHRAVLSSDGPLLQVPRSISAADPAFDLETATQQFHKNLITKAIRQTGGNKEEAAKLLGLSRSSFYRYKSSLGL